MKAMHVFSLPVIGILAGVLVGALAIVGMRVADFPETHVEQVVEIATPQAAEEFIAQYRRSRTATWVVRGVFERTLDGKTMLTQDVQEAQDLSQGLHMYRMGHDYSLVRDGRLTRCVITELTPLRGELDGQSENSCKDAGAVPSAHVTAERWIAFYASYVGGGDARYGVAQTSETCFALRHQLGEEVDAWGAKAEYCFDPTVGSIVSQARVSGTYRDVTTFHVRSSAVTEHDFVLPTSPDFVTTGR